MKNISALVLVVFVCLFPSLVFGQKKLTILGSSTAAGNGASVIDSSWVGRLQASFRKNMADGVDTVINNRAVPGYVTYQSLPTGYPTPPARPVPDPAANITYVLNEPIRPDVVIINYPTNDIVSGYDPKEMMDNLRLMYQQLTAVGILCYITTSQPRNTASDLQRTILRQVVDSINNNFGSYAINFWDDLVSNDGLNMIRPEVNADGTHPNDLGHRLLFQRVQAKNIFSTQFPLPLVLKDWQVRLENNIVKLKWSTYSEEPNTSFEIQRSVDAREFRMLYQKTGGGLSGDYQWEDQHPLTGRSSYRLKIIEPGKTSFSTAISVNNDQKQFITSLYSDGSVLHVQLNSSKNQTVVLSIISNSGAIVKKQSQTINASTTVLTIPIAELSRGNYFLRITSSDGPVETASFAIVK